MSIVDARELEVGAQLTTDICIVGAGAAGLTIAGALDGTPRDVCVIESGGFEPDPETQALYDIESRGYPQRERFMSRARYYGGSCNLWAGRSMMFTQRDLEGREWVAHSRWPLAYPALADYVPAAARLLGLPPVALFDAERHAGQLSDAERLLLASDALAPTVSLWARRPKRFGAAYRRALRRSRNVRLIVHGNVTRVHLDPGGTRAESVDGATLSRKPFRVHARAIVLACGGLENARLLLVSRDQHACGIGNAHDVVGRYFMDHPRAVFGKVRLRPGTKLSLLGGCPLPDGKVQLGIAFSEETQRREGLLDHYATLEVEHSAYTAKQYESFIQTMKVLLRKGHAGSRLRVGRADLGEIPDLVYLLAPRELVPHSLYRGYWHARKAIAGRRGGGGGDRVLVYFCEQPPDPDSRVTLSTARDALGMNRLVLDWRVGTAIRESVYRLQSLLAETIARTGVGSLEEGTGEIKFTDASHHMGTTRMSESPRTGVVDASCMVHGVHGLFVAGSSVLPSASHKNPTLTIVALALRLAEHLRQA